MKKPQFTRAEILEAVARLALADEIEEQKELVDDAIDAHFTLTERVSGLVDIHQLNVFIGTKLKLYRYFLIVSIALKADGYEILYRTLDQ